MLVDGHSEEYELACLEAVRRNFMTSPALKAEGIRVENVELTGPSEDRRIVVSLNRRGQPRTVEWRLYRDWFSGRPPEGTHETPAGVVTSLMVDALGG